jgi:hypothetical protein
MFFRCNAKPISPFLHVEESDQLVLRELRSYWPTKESRESCGAIVGREIATKV